MSVIPVLLIASISIAAAFLIGFIWSVRNGQYDDDYTPSVRILFDERKPAGTTETETKKSTKKVHESEG